MPAQHINEAKKFGYWLRPTKFIGKFSIKYFLIALLNKESMYWLNADARPAIPFFSLKYILIV
jgi:hypothetical protein